MVYPKVLYNILKKYNHTHGYIIINECLEDTRFKEFLDRNLCNDGVIYTFGDIMTGLEITRQHITRKDIRINYGKGYTMVTYPKRIHVQGMVSINNLMINLAIVNKIGKTMNDGYSACQFDISISRRNKYYKDTSRTYHVNHVLDACGTNILNNKNYYRCYKWEGTEIYISYLTKKYIPEIEFEIEYKDTSTNNHYYVAGFRENLYGKIDIDNIDFYHINEYGSKKYMYRK